MMDETVTGRGFSLGAHHAAGPGWNVSTGRRMDMRATRANGGNWPRGVNLAALEREVGEYVDEARGRASQLHASCQAKSSSSLRCGRGRTRRDHS
jgi:hypothetical protein